MPWRFCGIVQQQQEGALAKKYLVTLTADERAQWVALTKRGQVSARRFTRAQLLLQADAGLADEAIAQARHLGTATVERSRKRFVEEGLEAAVRERPRPGGRRKLDGRQEACRIALACSLPPEGRACWTMPLLADTLGAVQVVEAISDETVRRPRKKTSSRRGSRRPGVFPVCARRVSGGWRIASPSTPRATIPWIQWCVSMNAPTNW
jgi:transposase